MMKIRRMRAVFKKQVKDTLKNKRVLMQFILFPVLAIIIIKSISQNNAIDTSKAIATLFATMFTGMVPLNTIASIIAEEKEKNTLRALMMSNVKPMEYLMGIGGNIFILCTLDSVIFGLLGGYIGINLFKFVIILIFGTIASLLLGISIGVFSNNQMSLVGTTVPIGLIFAYLPMLSEVNNHLKVVSQILYTQQLYNLLDNLNASNFTWDKFAIITANILVFLGIFIIAFRKRSLSE